MTASRTPLPFARAAVSCLALAASAFAFGAANASDNVTVEFVHPEKFTDLRSRVAPDQRETDAYLADLRHYIEQRAASDLGPDRKLDVAITDVRMAGEIEPDAFHHGDIRVMKSSTPPRIELTFRITDTGGHVLKSGERHLIDLAYLSPATRTPDVPLAYEKKMLADWLSGELRN